MNLDLLSGELEEYKEAREFWLEMLPSGEEIEMLTPDQTSGTQSLELFREQRLSLPIHSSLMEGILKWSSRKDSLTYVVLLSGVMTTLAKLRSNPSVIIGCPTTVGSLSSESAINQFLPIRISLDSNQTVKQLWKELNVIVASAYRYQYYPVERIQSEQKGLESERLCNVACELSPMHTSTVLQGCRESAINGVTFAFKKSHEEVSGELIFNAELYTAGMMQALADTWVHVLEQMVENPDSQVKMLSLVNAETERLLLTQFHSNKGEFEVNKSVTGLFEEQMHKTPDRIAIASGKTNLSYKELGARVEQLSQQLAEHGVKRGNIIGVVCDRTLDSVTAMLAVLRSGAAYLPIDPDYPEARISYMLEDSGATGLITPSKYAARILFSGSILLIQHGQLEPLPNSVSPIDQVGDRGVEVRDDIAYVIYTSGSTGMPKGVMVGHQGMANLSAFFRNELGIRNTDKIVQFASASFDASIWEMFMAFFSGAELHLLPKEMIESYESFMDYVSQAGITIATLPPTYASHLEPSRMPTLRMLVTAGSASSPELAKRWGRHLNYLNAYGPTESTICATVWMTGDPDDSRARTKLDMLTSVPIGKPILNSEIYIVNDEHHLLPIGYMGEMCIGGVSLALGYLGREQLTAERFVANPFVPGEIMYKTGDYAKWLPDGNVDFLGRIDHQVKIRGFRIEIGEIEAQLLQHPDVKEVYVMAKPDRDGEACLCAYVTPSIGNRASELKEWLASRLPAYMLPQYYIWMDKLPLTANGKIHTEVLPEPTGYDSEGLDVAEDQSATATERKLAELWKMALGIDRVNRDDHFFTRGGHSLKAATLITDIYKYFQIQLSLRTLMEAPTLRGMAESIDKSWKNESLPMIEPAEPRDFYSLSLAQKRLFILNQYDPKQVTYNIPVALQIDGTLDLERLQNAITQLIERHETLRTTFMLHAGNPVQHIHEHMPLHFVCRTIQGNELGEELRNFVQPFDLTKAPLFRVELLKISQNRYVLCLDMHHIISDGVSMSVLIDDMMRLYQGDILTPLRLQYKDFACWQNDMLETGKLAEQEAFWLSEFQVPAPLLQIQTDYPRQASVDGEAEAVKTVIPSEVARELNEIASKTGATLYMVLLSAYSLLLSIYSGQRDIVVGTPVAGRSRADLQPMIGMFVNILPIRSRPENEMTYLDFLHEVKGTAISAFENQDFPFDELIRKLNVTRDIGRNPLFDASFALQNMDTSMPVINGLSIKPVDLAFYQAKFDLTLWAEEAEDEILLMLEYRSRLYTRQNIEKMLVDLKRLIDVIIHDPYILLGQIDLRTSEEIEEQARRLVELEAALEMDFEL